MPAVTRRAAHVLAVALVASGCGPAPLLPNGIAQLRRRRATRNERRLGR